MRFLICGKSFHVGILDTNSSDLFYFNDFKMSQNNEPLIFDECLFINSDENIICVEILNVRILEKKFSDFKMSQNNERLIFDECLFIDFNENSHLWGNIKC